MNALDGSGDFTTISGVEVPCTTLDGDEVDRKKMEQKLCV